MILTHIKRGIGVCLITCMVMTMGIGCSTKAQADSPSEVVILENQQQEIQDVLAVQKITPIEGFRSIRWISDTKLIGEINKDGVKGISIYDMKDGSLTQVSKNTRPIEEVDLQVAWSTASPEAKYVLYKEAVYEEQVSDYSTCYGVYAINVEDNTVTYLGNGIGGHLSSIEDSKVLYTKGIRIFENNLLTGEEEEIKLPESLIANMKDYPTTFEGYLDMYNVSQDDRADDYYMNNSREIYKSTQECYDMIWISRKGDEIRFRTPNLKTFVYNRKTKDYSIVPEKVQDDNYYNDESNYPIIKKEGLVEMVSNYKGPDELWKIDKDGNKIELIDKGKISGIFPSPDGEKLAYSVYEQEERKLYIYDHNSGKKISLFSDLHSAVFWHSDSNTFLFLTIKETMSDYPHITTNIVTLN